MPIVNALSDFLHPCQFMTDMFTLAERYAPGRPEQYAAALKGKKIAFLGDTACNMANSFVLGGAALVVLGVNGMLTSFFWDLRVWTALGLGLARVGVVLPDVRRHARSSGSKRGEGRRTGDGFV